MSRDVTPTGRAADHAGASAPARPLAPIIYAATLALLVALGGLVAPAAAQVPGAPTVPPSPTNPRRPTQRQPQPRGTPADTTPARRDTAELVKWFEPDSVMVELQARPGFSVTRYQGAEVLFDARNRRLTLVGDTARGTVAAVARDQAVLVGDTVIYDDSTQIVRALGDTVILRDPSQGSDVVARGSVAYDMANRKARVTNITTDVTSGEQWFVAGKTAVYRASPDTTGSGDRAFYVLNGSVTSCDDPVPDYHFEAKEIKLVSKKILVARPAVLYIADVPVMVVPFLFQDLRSGRRSGLLPPRFGVNELFRNSQSYRRHFDNLGYYFAISDYTDAQVWLDWRSGSGGTTQNNISDPGWVRYNGEWRYRWLDRFLAGRIAANYMQQRDGFKNTSLSWSHNQEFSQNSRLTTNVNYVTSTKLQRQNTFNPYATLATIASAAAFSNRYGPFSLELGGDRKQYPGRDQVDQTLPRVSINSEPIGIGNWLVWTPTISASNQEQRNADQLGSSAFTYRPNGRGGLDSTRIAKNSYNRQLTFNTPLKIFGFQWQNSFTVNDDAQNYPQTRQVLVPVLDANGLPVQSLVGGDSLVTATRLFRAYEQTTADWQTGIGLPALFQGTWNLTPSVSIVNVAGGPFWVRSTQSGGQWVHQGKRLQYALTSSPTFFGLFPGFGPVSRFRHAVSPVISYSYAPAAKVNDAYLLAQGRNPRTDLSSLAQNAVSLGLSTNLEAKLRSGADTSEYGGGTKLKVLSLRFDQLGYDFQKVAELRRRANDPVRYPGAVEPGRWAGLTTDRYGFSVTSDLLPGFEAHTRYSLFRGDPVSDTAVFKPFREEIGATFSLNQESGIFAAFSRIFGRAVEPKSAGTPQIETTEQTRQDAIAQQVLSQPVAGSSARDAQFAVPTGRGWQGSFTFSSTRQRPVSGVGVVRLDPATICAPFRDIDQITYQLCQLNPQNYPGGNALQGTDLNQNRLGANAPIYVTPPLTTLGSQMSFNITPRWAASWGTQYDFRAHDFASQIVTVQREMHDWRAIFAFTKSPNGNFAFNFFVSLNAQPELKLNFDRRSYPDETIAR